MQEALANNIETLPRPLERPALELIKGGGESTPPSGSLEVVETMLREDCMLAEIDDLDRYRDEAGNYDQTALDSVLQNKVTAVKEGAIVDAVSEVKHQWLASAEGKGGLIMDLGRTAVETAMRGSLFYKHEETQARGDVEVAYARHNQSNLKPGTAHVMISPKMTATDAPLEVAKSEGLAETDSIQINWLDLDEEGNPREAMTKSILAPDVPIDAWTDMLADPGNIFEKAIEVEDNTSALSVMEAFPEMEVSLDKLPEGPITILEGVLPYIQDPDARTRVAEHIDRLREDQEEKHERALNSAERWQEFDIATIESSHAGYANRELERFISSLDGRWGHDDQEVIDRHRVAQGDSSRYVMSRELASVLQNAQRNMVLTAAAVVAGNEKVLRQIEPEVASRIYHNELAIQQAQRTGQYMSMMDGGNNQLIASQNVKVGGGCLGINEADFMSGNIQLSDRETEAILGFMKDLIAAKNAKEAESKEKDGMGSLVFSCQKGHRNKRERNKKIPCCTTCGISVDC